MYHSITYGEKNTWDDWHLVPTSRPLFNPPSVKTSYIDIPGSNGLLDLTDSLTGFPVYNNRSGSHEFIVANGYRDWVTTYSIIMDYLHGKRMKAVLEDDKGFYYEGRFSVNSWRSNKSFSTIVIDYNVYPFKKNMSSTLDEWLWDPFNFETGIIQYTKNITINGEKTIEILGSRERSSPVISSTNKIILEFKGERFTIESGSKKYVSIIIEDGLNSLKFIGNSVVSIEYRGGEL